MNSTDLKTVEFRTSGSVDTNGLYGNHIVLITLNAKYIHASLGLRYLYANLEELHSIATLKEFTINQRPIDIVEQLLSLNPAIIGFGVYIWNIAQTTEVIGLIKNVRPDITVVIGGPEVSYEYSDTDIFKRCDFLITGQADFAFRDLCKNLLHKIPTTTKVVDATTPPIKMLTYPYKHYNEEDIANRILYVEASRGCPFKCEFCLSALDKTAKPFALSGFLHELDDLYKRGARQFKFVDRTFNLKAQNCVTILEFFLQRMDDNLFVHFEVIPDKLPEELKSALKRFPPGVLQFEVGIQSFNLSVQETISRKQDETKTLENLQWLRQQTHAYIHADLIVGLPGETLTSFAKSFDQLVGLKPHEIQVGILKRLRGTNIIRHTDTYEMCYASSPPYQLLQNRDLDFQTMQRLQRFARYWDMIANSSRFNHCLPLILGRAPFDRFWRLSDWLFQETSQTHRISLARLFGLLHDGVRALALHNMSEFTDAIERDHKNSGEKKTPVWRHTPKPTQVKTSHHAKRQLRLQNQA